MECGSLRRRKDGTGGVVTVEHIGKVEGRLVVEGFESDEEYFELNPLRDREPVEFLEDGGDVVKDPDVGEQASSRVLDVSEFIEEFGWCAIKAVAVVISWIRVCVGLCF